MINILSLFIILLSGSISQDLYDGPGIIGIRNNALSRVITEVYIGSPAYWGGVKPKDKIISLKPNNGNVGEDTVLIVKRGKDKIVFNLRREAKKSFYSGFSLTKDGVKYADN